MNFSRLFLLFLMSTFGKLARIAGSKHPVSDAFPILFLLWLLPVSAQAQQLLAGEREAQVTAIPGVVAAGSQWQLLWADFVTADGIVGTADGGVLFAQEQTDTIVKLNSDGQEFVYLENTNGGGSISLDAQGQLFAVQRTCTEIMNPELPGCNELTRVAVLAPQYKLLANSFADGEPLGRLNDLIADGKGGAYFTSGGAYYVNARGVVSIVAQDIRANGIMLSPDGKTLYVTDNTVVLAFTVAANGATSGRRTFAALNGDDGGDGMAVDAQGRLYVTASLGVHVLSAKGDYLGLIPTPRRAITLAFSGPEKKTLYVPQMGAVGPDGKAWTTPEGIRNTAMTIYTLPMLTPGYAGRPK
ncbi:MAG: SMP-30/gluconolactonase/LRE family protein [Pseudomonadales bacterium]|nr:SMP-30/gluconolactonase/LRE family protein [Pseudomonadales bacterium]